MVPKSSVHRSNGMRTGMIAAVWACCAVAALYALPARASAQGSDAAAAGAGTAGATQGVPPQPRPRAPNAAPLEQRVTLSLDDVTLNAALQALVAKTGVKLIYSARVVPLDRRVSLTVQDATV